MKKSIKLLLVLLDSMIKGITSNISKIKLENCKTEKDLLMELTTFTLFFKNLSDVDNITRTLLDYGVEHAFTDNPEESCNSYDKDFMKTINKARELPNVIDYNTNGWAQKTRRDIIDNETDSERIFKGVLDKNNVCYVQNYPIKIGVHQYFVDFYLPEYNCVIEVDGEYHFDREQRIKDLERQVNLEGSGYHVYRITNNDCTDTGIIEDFIDLSIARAKNEFKLLQD